MKSADHFDVVKGQVWYVIQIPLTCHPHGPYLVQKTKYIGTNAWYHDREEFFSDRYISFPREEVRYYVFKNKRLAWAKANKLNKKRKAEIAKILEEYPEYDE